MRALRIASRLTSGQAVDGLLEQVRAGVRHLVPALELRRVAQAEVGGEVDDLRRRRRPARAPAPSRRRAAWRRTRRRSRRARRRRARRTRASRSGRAGSGTCPPPSCPASLRDVMARTSACGCWREQAQQLDPRVAGAADDADLDHLCLRHETDSTRMAAGKRAFFPGRRGNAKGRPWGGPSCASLPGPLALAELLAAARLVQADLLALDLARVARDEPRLRQRGLQLARRSRSARG